MGVQCVALHMCVYLSFAAVLILHARVLFAPATFELLIKLALTQYYVVAVAVCALQLCFEDHVLLTVMFTVYGLS